MKKRKERCVHCLKTFDEKLTRDHIFPDGYNSNPSSNDVELWTAPACNNCNKELGKVEEDLRNRLALSLSPNLDSGSPTSNISQRALRSFNPGVATSERDRRIREARAKKVLQDVFRLDGSTKGIFPNFGYHSGWKPEEQYGILIPADEPEKMGKKIIRGIEYKLENRFVDPSFKLQVYFCYEDTVRNVSDLIQRSGQRYVINSDFEFYRSAPLDKRYCLYKILIWDKLIIYGSLMKKRWWQLLFSFRFWEYKILNLFENA